MEERVLRYMQAHAMVQPGFRVTVALSGGADSVCLLHILLALARRLRIRVSAVHVHHGIRDTADRDEEFVRELCGRLGVELTVCHVDVPEAARLQRTGIEETARRLRYAAFETLETDCLALAHHSQDQAETVLLNLLRGSGLRGLAGMLPVYGKRIRPLLQETPETIREYLIQHGCGWVEDETNQDTTYRRNYLRHQMIPLLQQRFNPRVVTTLADTAELLQEDEAALMEMAEMLYRRCRDERGLPIRPLQEALPAVRKRCLRLYLQDTTGLTNVSRQHMEDILGLLKQQSGRRVVLPRGYVMLREYERIYVRKPSQDNDDIDDAWVVPGIPYHGRISRFSLEIDISFVENMENLTFPEKIYTKCFDYDTIKNTLEIRTRRPGDYLTAAGGHKKLKDYLIDERIPASQRDQIPLLADGSHILWVIGYRMSDACKIRSDTTRAIQVTCTTYTGINNE